MKNLPKLRFNSNNGIKELSTNVKLLFKLLRNECKESIRSRIGSFSKLENDFNSWKDFSTLEINILAEVNSGTK